MSSQLAYEKEDVSVSKIAVFSFLPVLFLILSIIGVHYYLKRAQFKASLLVNRANSTEIDQLKTEEERRLNSYSQNGDGSYTIPIERAIDVYIQE